LAITEQVAIEHATRLVKLSPPQPSSKQHASITAPCC